ncbi:FAD-binding domain-containing protein [Hysterangium stoloniferum]|nr:FAD-binding domain-containing protein [Hysterangium stoloniferum]
MSTSQCFTQPGDPGPRFPTTSELASFNATIDVKLYQSIGGCSEAHWTDGNFRNDIIGAVLQDYTSTPPSLCLRNGTVCGQGNVPILGVNATTVEHIQAAVRLAKFHNLKIVIKASVGDVDQGSAVTAGSGVGLATLYALTKEQGKIYVGGTAASIVASGGYVQGAGHSILSPTFGLAADNALRATNNKPSLTEFEIVTANGTLLTVNSVSNPDLFWALRGGGAGSWGVIVSTTFRTFPTFNGVYHVANIMIATPPTFSLSITSIFPNTTISTATSALTPFLNGITSLGFNANITSGMLLVNDLFGAVTTDGGGTLATLGSRLLSSSTYKNHATEIGQVIKQLFDNGAAGVLAHLVAGGQVSKNAHIDSAVTPKWRTAKTHVIVLQGWNESTSPSEVEAIREVVTNTRVPLLAALAGPDGGAYSNEADVREPNFQTTFFGPNYGRLSQIKKACDPDAMFLVPAGVGSENFDVDTLCRVD